MVNLKEVLGSFNPIALEKDGIDVSGAKQDPQKLLGAILLAGWRKANDENNSLSIFNEALKNSYFSIYTLSKGAFPAYHNLKVSNFNADGTFTSSSKLLPLTGNDIVTEICLNDGDVMLHF